MLIQPLIGQYKKNEYRDSIILNLNKKIVKIYKSKNFQVYFLPFYSYPRYGGPKEAALHALVRKNFGCTHFWVGRDHAGVGDFYSNYASRNYCKKNIHRIGIKIYATNEPTLCLSCKKISDTKCCRNMKKKKLVELI